jgi:hypothetical protein
MNFPIYPHLGITEAELVEICEALFADDPVLAKHLARAADFEVKILQYEEREREHHAEVDRLTGVEDDLRAEMKKIGTMKAETHGLIAGMKYHIKLAKERIKQCGTSRETRKRQLYMHEVRRRLGILGKELKLGIGGFRAGKGLGTAVYDRPAPKP